MEQKKSYIGIRNSVETSTLELFFTDDIFDEFDWKTWETKNLVQDTIDKIIAAKPSTIKVTINSLGGDVMIGLAIYNFLKNYKAEVEVEIIGFAASIASVIAMSASKGKLKIANNGFMIIHAASSFAWGNAKELKEQAEVLDKISKELASIYALRSRKETSFFTDLWADGGDVWLSGSEAKEMGLADELINGLEAAAKIDPRAYGLKNIPKTITSSIQKQKNMAFEKTLAAAKSNEFAVVDNGFLLDETALNNLEQSLADSANVVAEKEATITKQTETIESLTQSIDTEKETVKALTEANATATARVAELEAAMVTAGTAANEKIVALEAQVAELGKEASGIGTNLRSEKDESTEEGKGGKPGLMNPEHPLNQYAASQIEAKKKPKL